MKIELDESKLDLHLIIDNTPYPQKVKSLNGLFKVWELRIKPNFVSLGRITKYKNGLKIHYRIACTSITVSHYAQNSDLKNEPLYLDYPKLSKAKKALIEALHYELNLIYNKV